MMMVLMLHLNVYMNYMGRPDLSFLNIISAACGIAIPLFFMVSGYLMAEKDVSFNYAFHKILNILKVTLIVCVTYDLYSLVKNKELSLSFPICFLQQSKWSHFWYFGTMIIIYLALPLLKKIIDSSRWKIVIIILMIISMLMWLLDIVFQFEEKYICQTFRLWYFFLYFLLGAFIKKGFINKTIEWYYVLLLAFSYTLSVLFIPNISVEYYFGSPICVLYAVSFFLLIINKHILPRTVAALTPTVLPAYIFHTVLIRQLMIRFIYPVINSHISSIFLQDIVMILFTTLIVMVVSKTITYAPKYSQVFKL